MEITVRLVLFAWLLTAAPAAGERVLWVKNGDTLVVTSAGREASAVSASLVPASDVALQVVDIDIYGRMTAYVLVDGETSTPRWCVAV